MYNTSTACPGKNLNANQLEHFINTIFEVLVSNERSFEMNYRNITRGSEPKLKSLTRKVIYQGFFERITSKVDAKTKNGDITIKVHTDGEIVRKWAEMKKFELSEVESSNLRLDVYPREDSNLRPKV